ncbi:MAG: histidine--tRNA ligase [Thermoanaerobaculia bacterium]
MGRKIQAVKGTRDLLPPDTAVWAAVERAARETFGAYGYSEIRTPILEDTELFVRSVGEGTDIVGKEMYTFTDRKGRSLSLRPESTASVARAFVQHGMHSAALPLKVYYIGPHFRYERPQKGRYRQFFQIGAELLGDAGPQSDGEVILMLVRFLSVLGFEGLVVQLNTVGDEESREAYRKGLVEYLEPHREALSPDSQRRLGSNPLRILDSKDPADHGVLQGAPRLEDFLNASSAGHFDAVCKMLDRHDVAYSIEPRLVRGLDYYTRTVFEITAAGLGAQDAIVGGGRYDGLIEELGGQPLPGIGFAIGEDRLIEVLPERFRIEALKASLVAVAAVPPVSAAEAVALAEELRSENLPVLAELTDRSVRSALKRADRAGVKWVVLIGEQERATGTATVRDLEQGSQETMPRGDLATYLRRSP